jgi:hypothetical protein
MRNRLAVERRHDRGQLHAPLIARRAGAQPRPAVGSVQRRDVHELRRARQQRRGGRRAGKARLAGRELDAAVRAAQVGAAQRHAVIGARAGHHVRFVVGAADADGSGLGLEPVILFSRVADGAGDRAHAAFEQLQPRALGAVLAPVVGVGRDAQARLRAQRDQPLVAHQQVSVRVGPGAHGVALAQRIAFGELPGHAVRPDALELS